MLLSLHLEYLKRIQLKTLSEEREQSSLEFEELQKAQSFDGTFENLKKEESKIVSINNTIRDAHILKLEESKSSASLSDESIIEFDLLPQAHEELINQRQPAPFSTESSINSEIRDDHILHLFVSKEKPNSISDSNGSDGHSIPLLLKGKKLH